MRQGPDCDCGLQSSAHASASPPHNMRTTEASRLESDLAVCAGYNAKVPFLPEDCPVTKDGKTELMHLVVHPKLPGVYFLGFIQAHGPMIPCVESQMSYAADLIQVCTPEIF